MKNYLGIETKMLTFTHTSEMDHIGTFCEELAEVLSPCGTFEISVSDYIWPMVRIKVPEDYGVAFEPFLDKCFGKGTADKWRAEVLDDEDDDM